MSEAFAVHRELTRTFRFYIALTVFANLGYAAVFGASAVAALMAPAPWGLVFLVPPAMVSTGFAALAAFGLGEAVGLHKAITATGQALALPHVTRSRMLPVQTALTLVFHGLFALGLYAFVFFSALGRWLTP